MWGERKMDNKNGFIIFDLETTCDRAGLIPRHEQEIIEIGAIIWASDSAGVIDTFQTFVRPVIHSELSEFCNSLTGIKQRNVDKAKPVDQVIPIFKNWCNGYGNYTFASWGDFDIEMLSLEMSRHDIQEDFTPHINLKSEAKRVWKLKKAPRLKDALKHCALSFEGRPHRALDDARNIAHILPLIIRN